MKEEEIRALDARLIECRACLRLVEWREEVGRVKRREFMEWDYWARPVPNFGDPSADRLIVGLAPAAHGANRTGRMFTGDRSGEFLYRALFRAGVANKPHSEHVNDGLCLTGVLISAIIHCAPPLNRPLPQEIENCRLYLDRLLGLRSWKTILCLGGIAWNNVLKSFRVSPRPPFGHLRLFQISDGPLLVGCYHPSQQNTFTGKLTEPMLDAAIARFLA